MKRPTVERCIRMLQHPRTQASVEMVYGFHGIGHATDFVTAAIYVAVVVVALAHILWAAHQL